MTRNRAALLALALLTTSLLAGCGTRTTIVKTRYVHPCENAKQMTVCVGDVIRATLKATGDIADVKVECTPRGDKFSCLRLIVLAADDTTDCARWTIRRVPPGIPVIVGGEVSYDCAGKWTQ